MSISLMTNCGKLENWDNQFIRTKIIRPCFFNPFLLLMKSLAKYYLIIMILALILASCNDNIQSSIPDFPVYMELNLTTTYPTFKNSYLKSMSFTKGVTVTDRIGFSGILVCTGFDGEYSAFDMCCPYEAKQNTRVHPNNIGQAICDSCGTVFDIGYGNGNPLSGKAKEYLKKYKASLSGDVLYITR